MRIQKVLGFVRSVIVNVTQAEGVRMVPEDLKKRLLNIIYGAEWYFECVDNGGVRGEDSSVDTFFIEEDNVDETIEAIVAEVKKAVGD